MDETFSANFTVVHNFPSDMKHPIGGIYPDIVAIHPETGIAAIVFDVATHEEINKQNALARWKILSNETNAFWLCIPKGTCRATRELLKTFGIRVDNLREYEFSVRKGIVEYTDCLEPQ